jgi:Beta-lactamase enzyme family
MGMKTHPTVLSVLAAGIAVIGVGAGVTTASAARPAVRAGRTARATAAPGGRTASKAATEAESAVPATAAATAASATSPDVRVSAGICTAPPAYRALAAKLSADIEDALRGRSGHQAVSVYDAVTAVSCYADSTRHFSSASIVKTIILATLLRWHQQTGAPLSATEKKEAALMITQSDNDAATYLWDEVGMDRLQDFLDAAKMNETELGQDGYWGLTQVTAHDEMVLLELLDEPNPLLDSASRAYALGLMSQVISAQRWGTPYGAPDDVTVHVKNGWLADPLWHVNSLGVFTGKDGTDKNYLIAVLTDGNPTEQDGIDTIQNVAKVVHRDLNEAKPS